MRIGQTSGCNLSLSSFRFVLFGVRLCVRAGIGKVGPKPLNDFERLLLRLAREGLFTQIIEFRITRHVAVPFPHHTRALPARNPAKTG